MRFQSRDHLELTLIGEVDVTAAPRVVDPARPAASEPWFAHQPFTLALVYGDKRTFDLRRRIFTWSPVGAGAVLATQHIQAGVPCEPLAS